MGKKYSYREIGRLYRRFQFHISVFVLSMMGIWLLWEIFHEPVVPQWLIYLLVIWALVLVAELFRFMYVFRSRRNDKKDKNVKP